MHRGINLAGIFDGGELPFADHWLDVIADGGFDLVRLPVRWPAQPPESWFTRIDHALDAVRQRGLAVVLDAHHFDGDEDALLALWARVAERYASVGPELSFELRNEPHAPMTAAGWNDQLRAALAVVRQTDPERTVIVGPARWNIIDALPSLELPDDEHLVVTVHYYSPFRFTHQGARWLEGAEDWIGTSWGSPDERARVRADLERAAAWARAHDRPLFLGEFGTLDTAAMPQRAQWTALVRTEAERLGVDWAYWDFATDFGAWDPAAGAWRAPLHDALVGSAGSIAAPG